MRARRLRKAIIVHKLLNRAYKVPDLGNCQDPVEELVFICLSRQTHQANATRSWDAIREQGGVNAVHRMSVERLERLLRPSGFGRQKSLWIKRALQLIETRFGELSLEAVRDWSDDEVEQYLRSLPGLSLKSSKCVMMYSLERQVLPVDTHVRRVSTRIGLVRVGLSEKAIHRELESLIPPPARYAFHVNTICHGRAVCTARSPKCGECVVSHLCSFGKRAGYAYQPAT